MRQPLILKLAGVGALVTLASATMASSASAYAVRPCAQSGPQIREAVSYSWVGARRVANYSIDGTCFPTSPSNSPDIMVAFSTPSVPAPFARATSVPGSSSGTISVPVNFGTLAAGQTETVQGAYCIYTAEPWSADCVGDTVVSNMLTITVP